MIIRRSTINLNYGNSGKKENLKEFISEYKRFSLRVIDILWQHEIFEGNYVDKIILENIPTWLSARAKQCAGKQAFQIVKSQRKRKKKTKPTFSGKSVELDSRFIEIQDGNNKFDLWIKLSSLGRKIKILLPSKKHFHFNKFKNWSIVKSARLRVRDNDQFYLDVFFEKSNKIKQLGNIIGLDCGYKKLAVLSDGGMIGKDLEQKIEKISRKRQGSKGFRRALVERDEYINVELKKIDLFKLKEIVVEDLKYVKRGTKGKIKKKFNNKLQRWVYRYFLDRLEQFCEVVGVQLHRVDPVYTSQRCSACGDIRRSNRVSEIFKCKNCGYTSDADYNASLNILSRFRSQEYMVSV